MITKKNRGDPPAVVPTYQLGSPALMAPKSLVSRAMRESAHEKLSFANFDTGSEKKNQLFHLLFTPSLHAPRPAVAWFRGILQANKDLRDDNGKQNITTLMMITRHHRKRHPTISTAKNWGQ